MQQVSDMTISIGRLETPISRKKGACNYYALTIEITMVWVLSTSFANNPIFFWAPKSLVTKSISAMKTIMPRNGSRECGPGAEFKVRRGVVQRSDARQNA